MKNRIHRSANRLIGLYLSVAVPALGCFSNSALADTGDCAVFGCSGKPNLNPVSVVQNLTGLGPVSQSDLDSFLASYHGDLNKDGKLDGTDDRLKDLLQQYTDKNPAQPGGGSGLTAGLSELQKMQQMQLQQLQQLQQMQQSGGGGGGGGQVLQQLLPLLILGAAYLVKKFSDRNSDSDKEGSKSNPRRRESDEDCPDCGT